MNENERLVRVGGICGIIAFLIYGSAILLNNILPGHGAKTVEQYLTALGTGKNATILMAAYFFVAAFGILGIVSMLGLHRALTHKRTSLLAMKMELLLNGFLWIKKLYPYDNEHKPIIIPLTEPNVIIGKIAWWWGRTKD